MACAAGWAGLVGEGAGHAVRLPATPSRKTQAAAHAVLGPGRPPRRPAGGLPAHSRARQSGRGCLSMPYSCPPPGEPRQAGGEPSGHPWQIGMGAAARRSAAPCASISYPAGCQAHTSAHDPPSRRCLDLTWRGWERGEAGEPRSARKKRTPAKDCGWGAWAISSLNGLHATRRMPLGDFD